MLIFVLRLVNLTNLQTKLSLPSLKVFCLNSECHVRFSTIFFNLKERIFFCKLKRGILYTIRKTLENKQNKVS